MKYIELLKANRSFLELVKRNGGVLTDIEMIDIYDKYIKMKESSDKKMYIMEKLAEEVGVTSRTLYNVIKRMENDIEI